MAVLEPATTWSQGKHATTKLHPVNKQKRRPPNITEVHLPAASYKISTQSGYHFQNDTVYGHFVTRLLADKS